MSPEGLDEQVHALERADLETLREVWRERIGAAPKLRSADLLRRILAWRMQSEALGGMNAEVRRSLRKTAIPAAKGPVLQPGVRLTREWRGRRYEVEVTGEGFCYDGALFVSLSPIATLITGVRWNGPRFFGLRTQGETS